MSEATFLNQMVVLLKSEHNILHYEDMRTMVYKLVRMGVRGRSPRENFEVKYEKKNEINMITVKNLIEKW